MPLVKLKHATLNFQLDGPESAPPLVLSNAIGTDLNFWDGQLAAFTEDFRVLRYDARGHGGSSSPAGDYGLADLGNDVIELMDWLEIESAHVCGVSLGGLTALWLAIAAPQRCRSLIAANTAARVGTRDGWIERIEQVREQGVVSIADTSFGTLLHRCLLAGSSRTAVGAVENAGALLFDRVFGLLRRASRC